MWSITGAVVLSIFAGISCLVQSGTTSPPTTASKDSRLEQMPRDLEIKFALSALPPHLRSDATAYVLDPEKGYQLAGGAQWERADSRNDVYAPMCFDSEGAKSILPVWMATGFLRAKGKRTAEEVKLRTSEGFKNGSYRAPRRSGVSYMIAPLMPTYPSPSPENKEVIPMAMPHYMFCAPEVTNKDIDPSTNYAAAKGQRARSDQVQRRGFERSGARDRRFVHLSDERQINKAFWPIAPALLLAS